MAENENTQLKTNIKNLERVLEIERQERSATEHKTLQVLQDVRFLYLKKILYDFFCDYFVRCRKRSTSANKNYLTE